MMDDAARIYNPMSPPRIDNTRAWLLYALGDVCTQLEEQREDSHEWDDIDQGIACGLIRSRDAITDAIHAYDNECGPCHLAVQPKPGER